MYYAQIDVNDICYVVTETYGVIEQANMIEIDSNDLSLLGKKRIGGNWETIEVINEP
jgi:hypothetical protein